MGPAVNSTGAGFTCPCCLSQTPHPDDIRNGYCPLCHFWTGDLLLGPWHLDGPCEHRATAERSLWERALARINWPVR